MSLREISFILVSLALRSRASLVIIINIRAVNRVI